MRDYTLIQPSIAGILSDDHLYFEGVSRPADIFLIKDGDSMNDSDIDILEKYFNDIYNLFLRKISAFVNVDRISNEETTKMQALLQELIKVKELIIQESEVKHKSLL